MDIKRTLFICSGISGFHCLMSTVWQLSDAFCSVLWFHEITGYVIPGYSTLAGIKRLAFHSLAHSIDPHTDRTSLQEMTVEGFLDWRFKHTV